MGTDVFRKPEGSTDGAAPPGVPLRHDTLTAQHFRCATCREVMYWYPQNAEFVGVDDDIRYFAIMFAS